jgi:exonuclease III
MRGIFWNIRGLGRSSRKQCIIETIKKNDVDFIGLQETKIVAFSNKYLESLTSGKQFCWNWLSAIGSAGGILLGVNKDLFYVEA